jgi:hypothetical protein
VLTGLGPNEKKRMLVCSSTGRIDQWSSIHLTVGGSDDNDSAVHVGSTSNHVLNVIGVTGAVDVSIVAILGLKLDVGGGDGDTTLALLGGLVNGIVIEEAGQALGGLVLGDSGSQGGLWMREVIVRWYTWDHDGIASYLAVIDVTDGTNVNMGLSTLESSSQSTSSQLVAGEDVVNRVGGARAQQGGAAGARQEVNGTGKRHLCDMGSHKNNQMKKRRWNQETRWSNFGGESTPNFPVKTGKTLVTRWSLVANQKSRIAEVRCQEYFSCWLPILYSNGNSNSNGLVMVDDPMHCQRPCIYTVVSF